MSPCPRPIASSMHGHGHPPPPGAPPERRQSALRTCNKSRLAYPPIVAEAPLGISRASSMSRRRTVSSFHKATPAPTAIAAPPPMGCRAPPFRENGRATAAWEASLTQLLRTITRDGTECARPPLGALATTSISAAFARIEQHRSRRLEPRLRTLAPQSIPFASRVRCPRARWRAGRRSTALGPGLLAAGPASAHPTPLKRRRRPL